MRLKCIFLESPKICAFHDDNYQLPNVEGQNTDNMEGQVLARFASRKEMLDGEGSRCKTQNGYRLIILLDD
jgi:hypothetical protein